MRNAGPVRVHGSPDATHANLPLTSAENGLVQRLGAINALRAAIERAQRRGAVLRRSVLERAFRGELVPQDPSDEPASVLLDRIRAECEVAAPTRRRSRA